MTEKFGTDIGGVLAAHATLELLEQSGRHLAVPEIENRTTKLFRNKKVYDTSVDLFKFLWQEYQYINITFGEEFEEIDSQELKMLLANSG